MLKVLHPGFFSTIQDQGRFGYAHYGVPTSGAMDLYAHQLANAILNNNQNASTIEITFGGAKFQFLKRTQISITGAGFNPKINGSSIETNKRITVNAGDVLSFGKREYGLRTYLAVLNGFDVDTVLGSKSFYKGITKENLLKKGDEIPFLETNNENKNTYTRININSLHFINPILNSYKGPEFDLLSLKQRKKLLEINFEISANNSRMGYFLEETIENNFPTMLSSGVVPGIVQLTPSGKLIVLMRDCQVTGGYPRVLQLTSQAINQLAQKTTKDIVNFSLIK
ncbi:biotin-dependent carboxyltransferase family protein [uncultured Tenacibaculum sp.]|uniref:5-oxoprolinase subunit C family protein n=1 Tax=uncultured Tenacibaculum sp. TaxID=174713 RepID=UPI00261A049E|nr:biotin-dependent carboxyltransferase family protein [uncultured Tenacibaculum sp.]